MTSTPATSNVVAFPGAPVHSGTRSGGGRLERGTPEVVIFPRTGVAEIRRLWAQFDADLDRAADANPHRFPWRQTT